MHTISSPSILGLLLLSALPQSLAKASDKRGLVFTPKPEWPSDNYLWTRSPAHLTWYYNYQPTPSPVYNNLSQSQFEFVPMLWGAPADVSDTTFLNTVKDLITTKGIKISHVLGFNEPDGKVEWGSSAIDPDKAAQVWVNNIMPLQEMGVKAGLPGCTGGWGGIPWLDQFLGNCSKIISTDGDTKNCTYDFVPIHWYGNFDGLASHIGTYRARFPDSNIWVTEYNLNDQDLPTTQTFFNNSADYLDRIDYVERYSLFGAFRSTAANVGPNAAMLSAGGKLTDIGTWYLGLNTKGVSPDDKSSSAWQNFKPSTSRYAAAMAAVAVAAFLGF